MHELVAGETLAEIWHSVLPPDIVETAAGIYAVGALTAGLRTPHCDLDLYVFGSTHLSNPVLGRVNGIRVDIEVRREDWLSTQLTHFLDSDGDLLRTFGGPTSHRDTLARFWYARSDVANDAYEAILTALRSRRPAHCADVLGGEQLFRSVGVLDDLDGFLDDDHVASVVPIAGRHLNHAMQALLCRCLQFNLGEKWIPRKLADDAALEFADRAHSDALVGDDARRMLRDAQCVAGAALVRLLAKSPDADCEVECS